MGEWITVSQAGVREAKDAGLPVRNTAAGPQVYFTDEQLSQARPDTLQGEAEDRRLEEEERRSAEIVQGPHGPVTVSDILRTPVSKLPDALSALRGVQASHLVVKAAARDPRVSAKPAYREYLDAVDQPDQPDEAEDEDEGEA